MAAVTRKNLAWHHQCPAVYFASVQQVGPAQQITSWERIIQIRWRRIFPLFRDVKSLLSAVHGYGAVTLGDWGRISAVGSHWSKLVRHWWDFAHWCKGGPELESESAPTTFLQCAALVKHWWNNTFFPSSFTISDEKLCKPRLSCMLLLSKEKLVMLKHKYNRNILVADSDTYKYKTVNQQLFQFGITLNYFCQ